MHSLKLFSSFIGSRCLPLVLMICLTKASVAQTVFTSLDTLWAYAKRESASLRSGIYTIEEARKAKIAAALGVVDWNANVSLSSTHNTRLPVTLFPADAFGGASGTYREVRTGIPYTQHFNQYAELKLINAPGWVNLKLARVNVLLSEQSTKLTEKQLFESVAENYYTILIYQDRVATLEAELEIADSIFVLVSAKHERGNARLQELQEARVNALDASLQLSNAKQMLNEQYISLSMLCDFPMDFNYHIAQSSAGQETTEITPLVSQLAFRKSVLQAEYARIALNQQRAYLLPQLSFTASNSYQQFSNAFDLFNRDVRWIQSNYIGFSLSWSIPDANRIAQLSKHKFDVKRAEESVRHEGLQGHRTKQLLEVELAKCREAWGIQNEAYALRQSNFELQRANYLTGIVSLSDLLQSFKQMVEASYQASAAEWSFIQQIQKVNINNRYP